MKLLSGYFLLCRWSFHFSRFSNTERQKNKFQTENKTLYSLEIGFLRVFDCVLCGTLIKKAFFTWDSFFFVNTNKIKALQCEKRISVWLGSPHLISVTNSILLTSRAQTVTLQQRLPRATRRRFQNNNLENDYFPQIDGTTSASFCDSVYTDASYAFHNLRCCFH